MSNELLDIELKVLLGSRSKTLEQVAEQLNLPLESVKKHYESATQKLSASSTQLEVSETFVPIPRTFRLERRIGEEQIGTMKVGSQIVEMLSKGIYSAPWNSLKELISNSFDADAKQVRIQYLPREKKLVINDDGMGMDYMDFDEHFAFIVRSLKRRYGFFTPIFKRPVIGKIGIGFIAVSELCDVINVTSAKKGADTFFKAEIDFSKMRTEEARDKEFYEVSQFAFTNYEKEDVNEHYTNIELLGLKKPFIGILKNRVPADSEVIKIKIDSIKTLVKEIGRREIRDINSELGPYWEFLMNLATVIPVKYLSNGPISIPENMRIPKSYAKSYRRALRIVHGIKEKLRSYNFTVFFNGMELRKPILLPNETSIKNGQYGKDLCLFPVMNTIEARKESTAETTEISYKGYFYYQRTRIIPEQLRGMIIRIKNVAVGGPNLDFFGHPYSGDELYFPQTFGEIYFETGLEEAMNIDRSTFKTSHQDYAETREALHAFLRRTVFTTAKKMYFKRRGAKAERKEDDRSNARKRTVKRVFGKDYEIKETRRFTEEPVSIDPKSKSMKINVLSDQFQGFKKPDRILLEDVAMALEMAILKADNVNQIRNLFWKFLRGLTDYRHD